MIRMSSKEREGRVQFERLKKQVLPSKEKAERLIIATKITMNQVNQNFRTTVWWESEILSCTTSQGQVAHTRTETHLNLHEIMHYDRIYISSIISVTFFGPQASLLMENYPVFLVDVRLSMCSQDNVSIAHELGRTHKVSEKVGKYKGVIFIVRKSRSDAMLQCSTGISRKKSMELSFTLCTVQPSHH